jgi:hypothetical protein
MVLRFTITHGKIIEIEAVANPERLRHLDLAVLHDTHQQVTLKGKRPG